MVTDEQKLAYNAAIDDALARARKHIARARGQSLTTAKREMLARAEAFASQAEQVRKEDLVAAKSLAERAELLSREVAER